MLEACEHTVYDIAFEVFILFRFGGRRDLAS